MRYPLILVHGIALHDRVSLVDFWGRIPQVLQDAGVRVYFGGTDAWGDYKTNAAILKATIDRVLEENETDRVNIIAHSKGGIDSRYMLWYYRYADKVASLTTVSTPHRGAELADLVYAQWISHTEMSKRGLALFGKLYGDKNPNMYGLMYQLTTEHMEDFNRLVTLDSGVYFQSVYSSMRYPMDDLFFLFTQPYILSVGGPNDGIVSEASAAWGPRRRKIEGSLSHSDMVDFRKKLQWKISIPKLYEDLVRDLADRGF